MRLLVLREAEDPEELAPLEYEGSPMLPRPGELLEVDGRLFQVGSRRFTYCRSGETSVALYLLDLDVARSMPARGNSPV